MDKKPIVKIIKNTTHLKIPISPDDPFVDIVYKFISTNLWIFEYVQFKFKFVLKRKYSHYSKKDNTIRIPAAYLPHLIDHLEKCKVEYKVIKKLSWLGEPVNINMRDHWRDRPNQVPAIDFLVNNENFIKGLALQTGLGKTYCAIKSITKINRRPLIITKGLIEQWKKSFLEQTDLTEKDIHVLQGFKSVKRYFELLEGDTLPKVIIASLPTLRNLVLNDSYIEKGYDIERFLEESDIGIKVVDECHENFFTNILIDLHSNYKHNIYLSATYNRNDYNEEQIFSTIFPSEMRYGEDDYTQYVDIYMYKYALNVHPKLVKGPKGYSQNKYEDWLMKDHGRFAFLIDTVICPLICAHYLNIRSKNQKLLILVAKVDTVLEFVRILKMIYPELNIQPFTADSPEENITDDGIDIIVSTPKSAGTGRDISNLRTVLSCVSIRAESLVKQILGRLRKLKNGDVPVMVDIYNTAIQSHHIHAKQRGHIYNICAKNLYVSTIK